MALARLVVLPWGLEPLAPDEESAHSWQQGSFSSKRRGWSMGKPQGAKLFQTGPQSWLQDSLPHWPC